MRSKTLLSMIFVLLASVGSLCAMQRTLQIPRCAQVLPNLVHGYEGELFLDPPTLPELITAWPSSGQGHANELNDDLNFADIIPDAKDEFRASLYKNSDGYKFIWEWVNGKSEEYAYLTREGRRTKIDRRETVLLEGDIIEIPTRDFQVQIPAFNLSEDRAINPYFNYIASRILSVNLREAWNGRDSRFPLGVDEYFEFARMLGWNPEGPQFQWISWRKWYEELSQAEQVGRSGIMHPALLLWPTERRNLKIDQKGKPFPIHQDDLYFAAPWVRISARYRLIHAPYIHDQAERRLNAWGFFTLALDYKFLAHDLLGHHRSLSLYKDFAYALQEASQKLFPDLRGDLTQRPDGIFALNQAAVEARVPQGKMARLSFTAENAYQLRPNAKADFDDERLVIIGKGNDAYARTLEEIESREMKARGFSRSRLRYLKSFLRKYLVPVGGYVNDMYLLSRNNGKSRIAHNLAQNAEGFDFRGSDVSTLLHYLALDPTDLLTDANRTQLLATMELNIHYWMHVQPEDVMRSTYDAKASKTVEVATEHFGPGSFTYAPFKSTWMWLPTGSDAQSKARRLKFFTDGLEPILATFDEKGEQYGVVMDYMAAYDYLGTNDPEVESLFNTWFDKMFSPGRSSLTLHTDLPGRWQKEFDRRLKLRNEAKR